VNLKGQLQLAQNVLEAARLQTARTCLGIAVHRIADPQHLLPGLAHRLDCTRQGLLDVLDTEAMNERQPARLVLRIQRGHEPLQPTSVHGRPDLHTERIGNASKELDVRAVQLRRAHADPRHVCREVVPVLLPRDIPRLRLLVEQMQPFMTREKVDRRHFMRCAATADSLKELERFAD